MLDLSQFTFVSHGCHSTYLNKYYNVHHSPFAVCASTYDDFRDLYLNFDDIQVSQFTKVPYAQTKIAECPSHWNWNGFNNSHNIDLTKCFAYQYKIPLINKSVEIFYMHYEDTPENNIKVQKRIARFDTEKMTTKPFFILGKGVAKPPQLIEESFLRAAQDLLDMNYEYKLLILTPDYRDRFQESKHVMFSSYIHEELMPYVDQHLRKYWSFNEIKTIVAAGLNTKKKLLLIGNKVDGINKSAEIEQFDFIVRLNRMNNYGFTGTRTDLLLVDPRRQFFNLVQKDKTPFKSAKRILLNTSLGQKSIAKLFSRSVITPYQFRDRINFDLYDYQLKLKAKFGVSDVNAYPTNFFTLLNYVIENYSCEYEIYFTGVDLNRADLFKTDTTWKNSLHRDFGAVEENYLYECIQNSIAQMI